MEEQDILEFIDSSKSKNTSDKLKSDFDKFTSFIKDNFSTESNKDYLK